MVSLFGRGFESLQVHSNAVKAALQYSVMRLFIYNNHKTFSATEACGFITETFGYKNQSTGYKNDTYGLNNNQIQY